MNMELAHLTFDCADPAAQAKFWSGVLDMPVDPGGNPFMQTIGLQGETKLSPAYMFLAVPEAKTAKNRMHLDFGSADWKAEGDRCVALGATKVGEFDEYGTQWVSLTDPEGNEFDIGAVTIHE